VHGVLRSDVVAHSPDGVSYASNPQYEDQDQHSENTTVERSSPYDNQARSVNGLASNAMSDDPEKLKMQLKMLRAKRGELEGALVELDKDIMETERSLLDVICA
jgi:hypothetical protein